MADHPWQTRSAAYRRSGPEERSAPLRWAAAARRTRLRRSRRHDTGWRAARWALAAFVPAAVIAVSARKRLHVPPPVALPLASAVPLAVGAAWPRDKGRYLATGAAYMWVFKVTWELPYDDPERLGRRLRVDYPIRADGLLGAGTPPGQRLQRALRRDSRLTAVDVLFTAIYGSWIVPHLVLGWVWLHHPEYIPRAAGRLAAAYHLTTPLYWAVPTAPPWWASQCGGRMDGEVERVVQQVAERVRGRSGERGGQPPGNPWGSMPSDHIASAAITAMGLTEVSPLYGALGWAYVALASLSVVYLGEHYLVDVLAGLAVAEVVRRAEPLVNPLVRRVAENLDRVAVPAR